MAIFSAATIAVVAAAMVVAMAAATIAVAAAAADIHRRKKREGAHRLPPFHLVKVAKAGNSLAFAASHAASAERSLTVPLASRRLGRPRPLPLRLFPEHAIRRKNQKETSMRGGLSLQTFGMGIGRGNIRAVQQVIHAGLVKIR